MRPLMGISDGVIEIVVVAVRMLMLLVAVTMAVYVPTLA